jgi:hypothetical protein
MADTPTETAAAFVAAIREPSPATRDAAVAQLAPAVQVLGPFGRGTGAEGFDAMLQHPIIGRVLGHAEWSAPEPSGDLTVITAAAPPAVGIGGMRFGLHLDGDGKIDRIEQDLLPAPETAPAPLALTDAQRDLLSEALSNGTPMIVAYVDAGGAPHLSYRATVQALGSDQLGMWIRDPNGGLVRALTTNPHLSFFYSDRSKGVTLQFHGRGRVDSSDAIRETVFDGSPEPEQNMDWRKAGVAVVIDLDRVEGRDSGGRVLMARA